MNEIASFNQLILAHTNPFSSEIPSSARPATGMIHKVGKFVVYVDEFEQLFAAACDLSNGQTVLVIDEIGKMELLSKRFESSIKNLLKTSEAFKVIATVPQKSPSSLIDQLKNHPNTQLFNITKSNRDEMYGSVLLAALKLIN